LVAAPFIPKFASQIVRLHQSQPANWIFWDYAGRLGAVAILAAIPAARTVAFRCDRREISLLEVAFWIVGIILTERLGQGVSSFINAAFPANLFGFYPRPNGWLYLIDLVFGLTLVAFSEEIIFRRCARHVLQPYLGEGCVAVIASSLMFGCYHWWSGLGNVFLATMMGILFTLMLKRSVALWPVALAHYVVDMIGFS
jgi:CAAX protease family protein